ncbi:hypothetical protein [Streptomyces sp. CA-111067]|uniref:hypothetical protein n=1 Tax=Streptomyces sp. CA-111067 TaxID=3240046 RepID=UPI003D98CFD8
MTTTEEPEVTVPAPARGSAEDGAEPAGSESAGSLEDGSAEGAGAEGSGAEGAEPDNEPPEHGSWRRWPSALGRSVRLPAALRRLPVRQWVAGAVVLVLLLAGGGFLYAGQQLRDPGATANHALTDTEATSQVTGDVSNALGKIFAYTPDSTQATAQAARDLLDGSAATQYQALFGQIRQRVADQQLTLTTRVVRAGVVSLTGSQARLLVFLDQTAQRAGDPATSAAAQLSVTAHLTRGHWRITDLKAR